MAGRILQEDVDEVKNRTNIAELIGERVTLKSAGVGSLTGLCPFHDERSPSFHVSPQVGFYHCFGCGESGDVYTFLQKTEQLSFAEAVEQLARRLGYSLRYQDGVPNPDRGGRVRLLEANQLAAEYFANQLRTREAEVARRFLGERGFDAAAAQRFGVGYAPRGWSNLTKILSSSGFSELEQASAGLVSAGDRSSYDRFRGRLIWPIRDVTGQTIGFGARKLFDDDNGPKYLNTPETSVYHKAQVLYGLDLAKRDISRTKRVVLVEGYTDVMACHLAGVTSAIATCGTAFGAEHIKVLRRVLGDDSSLGEVIFTFDGDEAGQKAALRAFADDQRFSAQTFVSLVPDGMDPCDLRLSRGDAAVRALVSNRVPLVEFVMRTTVERYDLETVEGRVTALRAAAPAIATLRDPALRPGYIRELARMLGVELSEVERAVKLASRQASGVGRADSNRARNVIAGSVRNKPGANSHTEVGEQGARYSLAQLEKDPSTRLERDVLQVMIQFPGVPSRRLMMQALDSEFSDPTLAVIRDGIAAVFAGTADLTVTAIANEVPQPYVDIVHQLAVAPVPYRDAGDNEPYVRGLLIALIDRDLLRLKRELIGRLLRIRGTDSETERSLQLALSHIDDERERLKAD